MNAQPTTTTARNAFRALTDDQKATARGLAVEAIASGSPKSVAWNDAITKVTSPTKSSGIAGKTFQRAVGHRLVDLRAHSASCSCGRKSYKGDTAADLRAAHAAHKAAKVKVTA